MPCESAASVVTSDEKRHRPETDIVEVSVVMPCLNEADTLETCIRKAQVTLWDHGINGEIIVADNGSSDGSVELARSLGARVVHVERRGYGSALLGGVRERAAPTSSWRTPMIATTSARFRSSSSDCGRGMSWSWDVGSRVAGAKY